MTQEENERLIECRQERYHLPTKIKTLVNKCCEIEGKPYCSYQEFIGEVTIARQAVERAMQDLYINEVALLDYCNGRYLRAFADDKPTMEIKKNHVENDCYCLIRALIDLLVALKRFDKWEKTEGKNE